MLGLNNRELAFVIWLAIFLVLVLVYKPTRGALLEILKILVTPGMLIPLLAMVAYVSLIVLAGYKVGAWYLALLKGTVFWFVGAAVVLFFTANNSTTDNDYFKKLLARTLKLTVVLEFIVNLYVFNIVVELLLVPVYAFIGMLGAVAEDKPEFKPVRTFITVVTVGFGFYLLAYAIVRIAGDFQGFATWKTLDDFLLPIVLTLALIPYLYALGVFMAYQKLFARLGILIKDKQLARFAKLQIIKACRLRLGKVNRFAGGCGIQLYSAESKTDVTRVMAEFRTGGWDGRPSEGRVLQA